MVLCENSMVSYGMLLDHIIYYMVWNAKLSSIKAPYLMLDAPQLFVTSLAKKKHATLIDLHLGFLRQLFNSCSHCYPSDSCLRITKTEDVNI